MNPAQTAQRSQKTGSSTSPFDEITALEERENARTEKEISALQKEKEEVSQSLLLKEEQAREELRTEAKAELKAYSEKELGTIVQKAQREAEKECEALEEGSKKKKASVVKDLVTKATDPDFLLAA